ncbi:MAG: M55 family metallopeptidase [Deltaproteobacteria bacterium]|nr:M55 family metallopeptidase [Deltaproteobacteria bacterium]
MNVFIVCDMEGATGVVHRDQLSIDAKEYGRARKLLTGDINAAVTGAIEAGAKKVTVCEGHGSMRNVLLEDLHEEAVLISGPLEFKDYGQIIGLDSSYDAAVFVGFHSKAGNAQGILAHTWIGAIRYIKVNGQAFGETALNAAICGEFNIPVVAVTGDNTVAAEAKSILGEHIETIEVKRALAQTIAECLPPAKTFQHIKDGVKIGLANKDKCSVFKVVSPYTIEISFFQFSMAQKAAKVHGVERIGDCEVQIEGMDYLECMRMTWQAISQAVVQTPEWMG